MQEEEDSRRREEAQKNEERNKQMAEERKTLEKQIHEMHLNAATTKTAPAAPNINYKAYAQQQKKGNLVTGRTSLFEQKVAELVATAPKPIAKPKTFKHEVKTVKPVGPPVNAGQNQNNGGANEFEKPGTKTNSRPSDEFHEKEPGHRRYPPFQGVKLPTHPSAHVNVQEREIEPPRNEVSILPKSTSQFEEPTPVPPPLPTTSPPDMGVKTSNLPQYDLPPVAAETHVPTQYDFPPEVLLRGAMIFGFKGYGRFSSLNKKNFLVHRRRHRRS